MTEKKQYNLNNDSLTRKIYINDKLKNNEFHYLTNIVTTRKYSLFTFLPKSLYLQFLKVSNFYFLAISVMQSFPDISPLNPIVSILPLVFVLSASLIREAFEDYKRYKNDNITNNQLANIYKRSISTEIVFDKIQWSQICVGDILKIQNNEEFPSDMLILTTSDENGTAFVETSNLDGERNLKSKQANLEIRMKILNHGLNSLKGVMLTDRPNNKIHKFKGLVEMEDSNDTIYLNNNNVVLRGTILKNTDFLIGMVIYAGHDCKIITSQGKPRIKRSHIEKRLNKITFVILFIQIILCIICAFFSISFNAQYGNSNDKTTRFNYLFGSTGSNNSPYFEGFITWATFFLLLNTLIPISLMVSIELAKFFQTYWIEVDEKLFDIDDQKPCKVLNMLINEELAKVSYIFSDKTGTLTSNQMEFKKCSIGGFCYSIELLEEMEKNQSIVKSRVPNETIYFLDDFWCCICICHDVVIDHRESKLDYKKKYQGSSPDEIELISTAAKLKYEYISKSAEIITIKIGDQIRDFRILEKLEFTSERKKMSVIVRDLKTNKITLYCKGADSIILKNADETKNMPVIIDNVKKDLLKFSKEGLRTLCIAKCDLEEEKFISWLKNYSEAKLQEYNILNDEDPALKIKQLEDEIESNLIILGATGLEDKLQEGVADSIKDFQAADINIWMLTGDKLETAENIGHLTNLITEFTKVFKIRNGTEYQTLQKFSKVKQKLMDLIPSKSVKKRSKEERKTNLSINSSANKAFGPYMEIITPQTIESFALIIDGEAISHCLNTPELQKEFLEMIPLFRTVICCRSTPLQKAEVVKFVKKNLHQVTLAIGDGGNDVNMIQAADIGIGIMGKEGYQAAYASDYCFTQFRFLWRLLLVHGRWNYFRLANFIFNFLYKNIFFTMPQFWFAFHSGFGGQSFFDDYYIMNFNTTITSVAPIYYAALEQDVNPKDSTIISEYLPELYKLYRKKDLFSYTKFFFWSISGILHSLIAYYIIQGIFKQSASNLEGNIVDFWMQSIATYTIVFIVTFILICMGTQSFTIVTLVCYIIFTLLMYFPAMFFIVGEMKSAYVYGICVDIISNLNIWLACIVCTTICVLSLYILKLYPELFYPDLADKLKFQLKNKAKLKSKSRNYTLPIKNDIQGFSIEEVPSSNINPNQQTASPPEMSEIKN